jgi:hypothetical protein
MPFNIAISQEETALILSPRFSLLASRFSPPPPPATRQPPTDERLEAVPEMNREPLQINLTHPQKHFGLES